MPKEGLHPELLPAIIECACGNAIHTRSVKGSYKIDVCSMCHPFFTGEQRLVDTEGRVERFNRRYALAAKQAKAEPASKTAGRAR